MSRVHPFFQIQHSESRIGKHFGKYASCVVLEELVDLLEGSVRVDEVHFQTHVAQRLVEEVECAAVNSGRTDEVIACLADIQHGIHRSRLTRAGKNRHYAAFEVGNLLLHRVNGGIRKACVEKAVFFKIKELCHLHGGIVFVCSALRDRQHSRFAVFGAVARLDAFCRYFELTHINYLPL